MKPRDFLTFFKTRSGKLVLFALVFGGGLLLFSALRDRSGSGEADLRVAQLTTNATDKPQVVQSIERPMQAFRPPPPKPEPPPAPSKTNEPPKVLVEKPKPEPPPQQLAAISLFVDAAAGVPEPKSLGSIYAPFGRLIPCETVITVDSASIQTPIVGLITEIDREFSGDQEGWGITDGSAGLRGRVIKSDDMAEIKLFAATFLSGAAASLTEKEQTIFGSVDSRSLNNAPFKGAQKVLSVYAHRIYEAIQRISQLSAAVSPLRY